MIENKWKQDFPQLNGDFYYFDSAATSLKPEIVINSVNYYNRELSSNINRGMYDKSQKATELYEESRKTIAKFINAKNDEIIFTRGTTASLNFVASAYGLTNLTADDEILTSELEHHSSVLPWINVASKTKAKLKYIELEKPGKITIEAFKKAITNKTKVVAINYVSNVMGYIVPIKEIVEIAHKHNAIVIVDGAQAVQHIPVDVKALDVDFFAFSGHKMLGPTGIGVLYGKQELLEKIKPIEFGGDMTIDVEKNSFGWKVSPTKFEAGTMPIAGAIGLKTAVDYLTNIGIDKVSEYTKDLYNYFLNQVEMIKGLIIYNPNSDANIFTFNLENVPSHDAISFFAEKNIALRAGQHCAKLIHDYLNINASLRGTIYIYNTYEEIDFLVETIKEAIDYFKKLGF
ncbi:MAG: cysteine desulfurase [Candidatus Izimaplasma sp.]|nr:cysteine desulfurase [Candidatus Izimaplasma bacterium]